MNVHVLEVAVLGGHASSTEIDVGQAKTGAFGTSLPQQISSGLQPSSE